jgi:hypothetical protein
MVVLLAGCGSGSSTATSDTTASTTEAAPVEELQELALAYWEAFNAYDPDLALSYLEESYRGTREESVRSEIRSIDAFGVQLGLQVLSAPTLFDDGTAEMHLELSEPLGTRDIRMAFAWIDGQWLITFAEEPD